MNEYFSYNIINPTFVIDVESQAVEIPVHFNQIIQSDRNGNCYKLSLNQRRLSTGLNAGVLTNSQIFYTSVPEIPSISKLNLTQQQKRTRTQIDIRDSFSMKNTHKFDISEVYAKPHVDNTAACTSLTNTPDSYIVS